MAYINGNEILFSANITEGSSVAVEVAQTKGTSEIAVMSQKAVTDELDAVEARVNAIDNGYSVVMEKGMLNLNTGLEANSNYWMRSDFLEVGKFEKIVFPEGEPNPRPSYVYLLLYDEEKGYINQKPSVNIVDNVVTIPDLSGGKYFRISLPSTNIAYPDGYEITVECKASGNSKLDTIKDRLSALENPQPTLSERYAKIVEDNMPMILSCFGYVSGNEYDVGFGAIVINDIHGNIESLEFAKLVKDYKKSSKFNAKVDPIIVSAGDVALSTPKLDGVLNPDIQNYIEKAQKYCVYHAVGQHESGFAYTSGYEKAKTLTHSETFDAFIAPMKDVWGLPDLTTNYYYKDFATEKFRLISLYCFNAPLDDDPNDNTKYRWPRGTVWYGQEQLEWLCDTLNSVPSDYGVIILMHAADKTITKDTDTAFYTGGSFSISPITNGNPIADIVEAYINRTSISKTYTCKDTEKYPTDKFSMTVNADFSQAEGIFKNYITGDSHIDTIGKLEGTSQYNFGLTSVASSYDSISFSKNGVAASPITLLGYNTKRNNVMIGRLGQQFYKDGKIRVYELFDLT